MVTGQRITIRHSILIAKPRELVWDYTQKYENRTAWDKMVLEASVLQATPNRIVKLKMRGNTTLTFVYKHDERPHNTSLATKEIISPINVNAGGSWTYEDNDGKTLWTQTNTIFIKQTLILNPLMPICKLPFDRMAKTAMRKAKQKIEQL